MQDDLVPILHELCGDTHIRVVPIDGVHPAGILTVVKFAQSVHRADIDGAILIICVGVDRKIILCEHTLQHIPHRLSSARLYAALAGPDGQAASCQAVGAAAAAWVAVKAVAQNGNGHRDRLFHVFHRIGDGGADIAVADHQCFIPGSATVKAGNCGFGHRNRCLRAVIVDNRQRHPVQIQFIPHRIHRLIASGNQQPHRGWFRFRFRYRAVHSGQIIRIRVEGIIRAVVIPFADIVIRAVRVGVFFDFVQAVLGGIHVIGSAHPSLGRVRTVGIQAGIHIQDTAYPLFCAAGASETVILNDIVPIQGLEITNNTAQIFSPSGGHRTDKVVIANITDAVVPALLHDRLSAQNTADIIRACHAPGTDTVFNAHAGGIRCGIHIITAPDNTARPVS